MKHMTRATVRAALRLCWLGRVCGGSPDAEGMRALSSDPSGGTGDEQHRETLCGVVGSSGVRQRFWRMAQMCVNASVRFPLGERRKGSPSDRPDVTPQSKGVKYAHA